MWQRKQTIYLITVVLLMIATTIMASDIVLRILSGICSLLAAVTIFLYKNRKRQKSMCLIGQVLILLWVAYFAYLHYYGAPDRLAIRFYVCLPFVAYILYRLARTGIQHDEDLVRSADRIR